jgi:hypothetical protein
LELSDGLVIEGVGKRRTPSLAPRGIRQIAGDQRLTAGIFITLSLKNMLLRSEERGQSGVVLSFHDQKSLK